MNKLLTKVFAVLLVAGGTSVAQTGEVILDGVTNQLNADTLLAGNTHVVSIRLKNTTSLKRAISNGFRIFSPDGANYGTVTGDTLPILTRTANFDLGYFIRYNSIDGLGSDTVGFAGAFIFAAGLPSGFDDIAWTMSFSTQTSDNGKQVCIDSCFSPPGTFWTWAAIGSPAVAPTWSGQKCWRIYDPATDVDEDGNELPTNYALFDNYPNPFNPTTTISYALPRTSDVTLKVYNMVGQEVRTLVNSRQTAGIQKVVWDGRSNQGAAVASGIYLYRVVADNFVETKKMMLVK